MTKKKIVVIGGGWAGCAAALTAEKAGADVTLLERTDMLLGTGLVGGYFPQQRPLYCRRRCIAMGAGDLFTVMEAVATHKTWIFPVINTLLFTISIKSNPRSKTAPEPRHQAADG